MTQTRPTFSVCIPAYNRARFLRPLLDSIFAQDCHDFNVIICEDASREREAIAFIAREFSCRYPGTLFYYENKTNLGYDANIRTLIEKADGEFCFFMGNDDLLCPGALTIVKSLLNRYQNIGIVLRSYAWFDREPELINQEIRYFSEERFFVAGPEAIKTCFRRSGVISGYVVHRESALSAATDKFDGCLYYQMHLTANVLAVKNAVFTPELLILCRASEPYEFGNSTAEQGKHTPGEITALTRVTMIAGILSIVKELRTSAGIDVLDDVMRDYANYFYPYIREQLNLPFDKFMELYRSFGAMGFSRYPMFHVYCLLGYALGARKCDYLTKTIRSLLGRSPQFGAIRQSGSA
jgi:abequosyltransferase